MKKILAMVLVLVISGMLGACGQLYCNGGCGTISFEKKHKVTYFGRNMYLCDYCYDQINDYLD